MLLLTECSLSLLSKLSHSINDVEMPRVFPSLYTVWLGVPPPHGQLRCITTLLLLLC